MTEFELAEGLALRVGGVGKLLGVGEWLGVGDKPTHAAAKAAATSSGATVPRELPAIE